LTFLAAVKTVENFTKIVIVNTNISVSQQTI